MDDLTERSQQQPWATSAPVRRKLSPAEFAAMGIRYELHKPAKPSHG